jgi:hypothetical protein
LARSYFDQIEPLGGTKAACLAIGRARATHYRRLRPAPVTPRAPRPAPPNKLGPAEVELVLSTLNSPRFVDASPTQAYYVLLDEGTYISRPHVSNDNPYSEAHFKTLKYCPACPERFGSIADARAFCHRFFDYYNHEHRHSGIAYHTPASVHYATAAAVRAQRSETLGAAYSENPARFRYRRPQPPELPTVAWINEPVDPVPPAQKVS